MVYFILFVFHSDNKVPRSQAGKSAGKDNNLLVSEQEVRIRQKRKENAKLSLSLSLYIYIYIYIFTFMHF